MKVIFMCFWLLFVACDKENIVTNPPEQAQIENEMAKILNEYENNSAASIKARASIPIQPYMTVVGNTVECVTIPTSVIKGVLNVSDTSVGSLCMSENVNKFSHFSPVDLYRSSDGLVYRQVKTPFSMGNFAGYNHNAYPSSYFYSKTEVNRGIAKNSSNQFTIGGFYMSRGEKPPVSRSGYPCSWLYTMLKVVVTDVTNNRVLTGFSAVQAMPVSTLQNAYYVTFTDALGGGEFSGSAVATLVYTDSTGTNEYGYGEDVYPAISLSVYETQPIPLSAAAFTVELPTISWLYVKNNVSPYNEVITMGYPHNAHTSYANLQGDIVCAFRYTPLGERVPPMYPGQTWPRALACIYSNGIYRLYSIAEAAGGGKIINNNAVPSEFAYGYHLTYLKDVPRIPLTTEEF